MGHPEDRQTGKATRPFPRALTAVPRIEEIAVVLVAFAATLHAEWQIIVQRLTFQDDARIHEFWMRRFQDPALFDDPLTKEFLATSGYQPPAFRALYWVASHLLDPVFFGELLPLVLQPLAVWLVFRIVREHTEWRPAAWMAAALFLVPWDILRFSGGHARAFAQPIVLLAVYLLLRRRDVLAALVPPVGMLLYPPAGLVALATLGLATVVPRWPRFFDRARLPFAAGSAVAVATFGVVSVLTGESQEFISADEARKYADFGPNGRAHFFVDSTLEYLKQNYSGFALRESGSILLVVAILLVVGRYRNARLIRREVWCMAIASLGLFALAHALLFRLYLPHRYTYALLPFACIVVGVATLPTFETLRLRRWTLPVLAGVFSLASMVVALTLFPLGPQYGLRGLESWLEGAGPYLAAGAVLAMAVWVGASRRPFASPVTGAVALGIGLLLGGVTYAGGRSSHSISCPDAGLYAYLQTLPKDAIIAGDPVEVNCIPIAARRPVVISEKLYQPWNPEYFAIIRERMFRTVRAYYGPSLQALADLRTRYGADYLLASRRVRPHAWDYMAPYSTVFRDLRRAVPMPAALRVPQGCRTWTNDNLEVYDLGCVAATGAR